MHDNPEQEARAKNRDETMKRSRQWEIVQSDSDGDARDEQKGDGGKRNDSDTSSDDKDISESDDDSSHKKAKKHNKKEKKEKKKKNKEKKHKKHKKDSKKSSSSKSSSSSIKGVVDQNEYGKFGIIREEHFFQRQREFEAYMDEVKGMPGVLGQSKREVMQYFKCYMEDYNTATMPHEKYYNLDAWEMEEYKRKQQQQQRASSSSSSSYDISDISGVKTGFNDEEERRLELKRQRELAERKEFEDLKSKMIHDVKRKDDMRRQSELMTELQIAYKKGDTRTVQRLERVLAPDEVRASVKHPWA